MKIPLGSRWAKIRLRPVMRAFVGPQVSDDGEHRHCRIEAAVKRQVLNLLLVQ